MSDERINSVKTPNHSITPFLDYYGTKTRVEFSGSCLKQDKVTFNHGKIVNIYNVYELNMLCLDSLFTLINCLFGSVSITKNVDINMYKYSGYGIGFDRGRRFSFQGSGSGCNVIIFGVDMSSSVHVHNKGKDIFILGKCPTQRLGEHSLTVEKMYSIHFTEYSKKFCLSLHYNGANIYLFVNGKEIHKFKAKDSEIVATPLCLGDISKKRLISR